MTISHQDRQLIVIYGNQSDCLQRAQQITTNLDCLLLEEQKKAHTFLGQEFDAVIFNCHEDFDPNAFGAISGTVRGGGFLLLLKPNEPDQHSLFLKRFWTIVSKTKHLLIKASAECSINLDKPQISTISTEDQTNAIKQIIHVVKGHRRRPLVITADRGRGKSAALGIAASKLFNDGYKNIIVCAPSKKTADIIFKHALENSPDCLLHFYSPNELQQQRPKADLVLIDEAAAIPVSLLTTFLKNYSRIVFSSTQHGYEGSGRGFSINFKKVLDNVAPQWVKCELSTPIRWKSNDSLEAFIFDALLLKSQPSSVCSVEISDCKIIKLNKAELINSPSKLSSLFGLLVSAHYQTKPSDLKHLLDDDLVSIHTMEYQENIIAVALVVTEGGIDQQTSTAIFEGTRRLKGHLVAQSLSANVGIENAPLLHGDRIIRIAVHPKLQHQGLGTQLLDSIIKNSQADYLSTSFGATIELLYFWEKQSFIPIYLGMKKDASSGLHSVVMLHAKNTAGEKLLENAQRNFSMSFPHLLSDPLKYLNTELVLALLSPIKSFKNSNKELLAFTHKQRGYENTIYPIWAFVSSELTLASALYCKLDELEIKIIVLKVLQKQPWDIVCHELGEGIRGKKHALLLLRQALKKLLS